MKVRNIHIWIGSYLKNQIRLYISKDFVGLTHIMFCFVDHFEPKWETPPKEQQLERVNTWVEEYPKIADKHADGDGRHPQHTWFYPEEEYEYEYLDKLNALCRMGYGEIELHLHHHNDTSRRFKRKLKRGISNFTRHGMFETIENPPRLTYAFIHGNWALDNSHRDGLFCGVNDELTILRDTGCYADFSLPSAPSSCQTRKINSIYYALDDPERPKSHNTGIDVSITRKSLGDLMIIQGPLTMNWKKRKYGILPRIENAEISGRNPGTKDRVDLWVKQHIHVKGKKDWIFVKVHCHGAQESDHDALLGKEADRLFTYLETKYNDGKKFRLHYVTARECYNIIKAAEAGEKEDPNSFRDYCIKPYRNTVNS
jgi:hypothetical protein